MSKKRTRNLKNRLKKESPKQDSPKMQYCKQVSPSSCFSGDCGLCFNCNKNTIMNFNKDSFIEENKRERDLSKLLGKKNVDEYTEFYNKKLFDWCRRYDYKDPFCYGYAPEKTTYNNQRFKLIEKKHSLLCDDIYCKMVYENTSLWEQQKRYPIMPIYKNENNNLCAICVNKY